MNKITGSTVYTVFHFFRRNGVYNFAGFEGVYSSKEKAEEAIFADNKVKECDGDYISVYFSKDGLHRWEIDTDMIR